MSGGSSPILQELLGGANTLPMQQGFGSPTMSGYGYNWYGGQPLTPEGGPFNQMSQAMAGPSYAPPGTNWYSGGGAQSYGGKGASPSYGGKGSAQIQPHYGPQPRPGSGQTPLMWSGGTNAQVPAMQAGGYINGLYVG